MLSSTAFFQVAVVSGEGDVDYLIGRYSKAVSLLLQSGRGGWKMSTWEVGVLTFIGIVLSVILWRKFNYTPPGSIEKNYLNYGISRTDWKIMGKGIIFFLWHSPLQ